jgi:hypothetical protein
MPMDTAARPGGGNNRTRVTRRMTRNSKTTISTNAMSPTRFSSLTTRGTLPQAHPGAPEKPSPVHSAPLGASEPPAVGVAARVPSRFARRIRVVRGVRGPSNRIRDVGVVRGPAIRIRVGRVVRGPATRIRFWAVVVRGPATRIRVARVVRGPAMRIRVSRGVRGPANWFRVRVGRVVRGPATRIRVGRGVRGPATRIRVGRVVRGPATRIRFGPWLSAAQPLGSVVVSAWPRRGRRGVDYTCRQCYGR